MRIRLLRCIALMVLLSSVKAHAVQVNFLSDNIDGIYSAQNTPTMSIDCTAPAVCNVAPGRSLG